MQLTFEVVEEDDDLVAVYDGVLGFLVVVGHGWEALIDEINEAVASAIGENAGEVEIEVFIDDYHRTRFKHHYDRATAERIRRRRGGP